MADDLVTEMFDAEPEIREWQERIRSFGVATPGSPLARDDETWEPSAPLATALAKLGSSAEHLLAALAVVQQQHPLAPYTLLRTAFLSASHAVWILAPLEGEVRQARALYVGQQFNANYQTYLAAANKAEQIIARTAAIVLGHLKIRERGALMVAATLPKTGGRGDTDVIRLAAKSVADSALHLESVAGQPLTADHWVDQAEAQWRMMSGDTHSLPWSALTRRRAGSSEPMRVGRLHSFDVHLDERAVAESFHVSLMTARHAWRLLDGLNAKP